MAISKFVDAPASQYNRPRMNRSAYFVCPPIRDLYLIVFLEGQEGGVCSPSMCVGVEE